MIKIKKISIRQTTFIIILLIISMRVIIEPSFMFSVAGRDGVISYFISFIVQIIGILFVCLIIKNNPNKKITDICEACFGKIITKILMLLLFMFFALKIIGVDFEVQNFLLEVFYEKLYPKFFLIPFFLVIVYVAFKGPRVFARLTEIFLPFGFLVLLYTLVIALGNAKLINALPLFSQGISPIIKGASYGLSQMGEFLALFFIMENIEIKQNEKLTLTLLLVGIISILFMTGFYLLFVSVFGEVAITLNEGIIRMTQFATAIDANFRIDGISAVMWLPINVILLCVYFYCAGKTLQYVFNMKLNLSIAVCFVLFFIIKFLPFISSDLILSFETDYFIYVSLFLQIVLPASIFIVSKIKKGNYYEKNYKISA